MEQKLDTVVLVMGELGLLEPGSDPRQGPPGLAAAGAIVFSLKQIQMS